MSTKPAEKTRTSGFRVIQWIETHCVFTQGEWAGQPFRLLEWEKRFILDLFELEPHGGRRYRWGLLGIPKKNGKTELSAALGLYFLIGDGEPSPLVVCAAASDDQADLVFGAARTMCELSPTLRHVTERYDREILVPSIPGARLKRVAAVAGANDGMNIHAVICDELHEWTGPKGRNVWNVLTNGTGARRQPMVLQISTAGYDEDTVLFEQYAHIKAIERGEIEDRRYFGLWIEAPKDADFRDPETWRLANPSYGHIVHEDFFRDQLTKKTENVFRRYFLNQWTESEEAWISAEEWDACRGDLATAEADCYVGVDIGQVRDSSAVVTVAVIDGKVHVLDTRIWAPQPGSPIAIKDVEQYVIDLHERFRVSQVVYDPMRFGRSVEALAERGLMAVEFNQNDIRMAEASTTLFDLIREGNVVHNGDPKLRSHVLAAVGVEVRGGFRIKKRKLGPKHVDAAVSLAMAAQRAIEASGSPDIPFVEVF